MRAHGPYRTASIEAWRAMAEWLARHNLTAQIGCGYGLALDDSQSSQPQSCRYDACVDVPADYAALKNDGIAFQTLPGGAFARIRHVGSYAKVRASLVKVRDVWLPEQPRLQLDRRRPLLVIYLDAPNNDRAAKLRCDVCVPVRTPFDDAFKRQKIATAEALA